MDDYRLKFCQHCGSKIPFESKFCPNCGRDLVEKPPSLPSAEGREGKAFFNKNVNYIRLGLLLINLLLFIMLFFMGSQTTLTSDEAARLLDEFSESIDPNTSVSLIVLNKISVCLLFFIPLFGTFFLAFISHNAGIILSAIAQITGVNGLEFFLSNFLFPSIWMEIGAYSLASAQGIMLLIGVFTRNFKREAKNIGISLIICIILLIVGSVIEAAYIA